jgi:hypothetical protein
LQHVLLQVVKGEYLSKGTPDCQGHPWRGWCTTQQRITQALLKKHALLFAGYARSLPFATFVVKALTSWVLLLPAASAWRFPAVLYSPEAASLQQWTADAFHQTMGLDLRASSSPPVHFAQPAFY